MKVYAAAVVKAPLTAIAAEYESEGGDKAVLIFDTAGATEQKFRADPEAELLITTALLIGKAEGSGALRDGTSIALGSTVAGLAVTPGSPKPDAATPEGFKAALLSARRIAVSDPARGATVGKHFMQVIEQLGAKDEIMRKIAFAPDGLETMCRVMAGEADLGVSQSSEIEQAGHDAFVGPFPKEFALTTSFSLWHPNTIAPAAAAFIARLTGPAGRKKLAAGGIITGIE